MSSSYEYENSKNYKFIFKKLNGWLLFLSILLFIAIVVIVILEYHGGSIWYPSVIPPAILALAYWVVGEARSDAVVGYEEDESGEKRVEIAVGTNSKPRYYLYVASKWVVYICGVFALLVIGLLAWSKWTDIKNNWNAQDDIGQVKSLCHILIYLVCFLFGLCYLGFKTINKQLHYLFKITVSINRH